MRLWLWVRWDRGGTGGGDGMTIAVRDNTDKERVRDASDIVRVIGEVISLKAKGREYVCLCPFHDDHRPSMNVVPAKQIFKCFVCGAGGDVFSFVQKYHHMEFREALEYLAERSGIDKAALSRLENGVHDNPTVETLMRYAAALGKRLSWTLQDEPSR